MNRQTARIGVMALPPAARRGQPELRLVCALCKCRRCSHILCAHVKDGLELLLQRCRRRSLSTGRNHCCTESYCGAQSAPVQSFDEDKSLLEVRKPSKPGQDSVAKGHRSHLAADYSRALQGAYRSLPMLALR